MEPDELKQELLRKLTDLIEGSSNDELLRIISQQQIALSDLNLSTQEIKPSTSKNVENVILSENEPKAGTSGYTKQVKQVTHIAKDVIKSKSNIFDHLTVFPSRPGSTDKGREYEIKMTALLALRCATMEDTQDMWLGSNVHQVGDFDDTVLCRQTTDGKCFVYLIQLKHQDVPKNITQRDFIYIAQNKKNRNKSLEDFSLAKYYKGFVELQRQLDNPTSEEPEIFQSMRTAEIMLVLFTNRKANKCDFLENAGGRELDFLNTSNNNSIYKFSNKLDYDSNFLQQLVLFSNQIHVSAVDKEIKKDFKKLSLSKTEEEFKTATDKFVTFIKAWTKTIVGDQNNLKLCHILTKRDIISKITDILLEPHKLNFAKDTFRFYNDPVRNIWNEIVHDKVVTLIDANDTILSFLKAYLGNEVRKYCTELKKNWADHLSKNTQELFYTDCNFYTKLFKIAEGENELTLFHIYQCLWFSQRLPLLLEVKNSQDYDNIIKVLKLCNFSAILIKSDGLKLKKIKENFVALNDLNEAHQEKILKLGVRVQGRCIKLSDFIEENALKYIKCKDIIDILQDDFNIGPKYESLSDYFIPRQLFNVLLKFEVLKCDETFIIKNEGAHIDLINKLQSFNLEDRLNYTVFIVDEFKKTKNKKVVHRLVFQGEDWLVWVESHGNTRNIIKYQLDAQDRFYDFNSDFVKSAHLVSGAPGMGKTVLMDFLTLQVPTDIWVLKIILNEHNEYYEMNKTQTAADHLAYFNEAILSKYGCTNRDLAQCVFQKIANRKRVLIMLDGFDEISVSYKDEVTAMMKCLYKGGFPMWVTTRPHMKMHLEDELNTIALDFKPFTIQDQKAFLIKYFSQIGGPNTQLTNEFVEKLLLAARRNLSDGDRQFTGIPLQTKLLADVFTNQLKSSLKEGIVSITDKFDLLYLYEKFIKRKTEILCTKYGKYAQEMRVFFDDHQKLLALEILFDKRHLFKLEIDEQLREYYKDKHDKLHIMQREGLVVIERNNAGIKRPFRVNFVHRTVAEFLAAQWLSENFSNGNLRTTIELLMSNRFHNDDTDYHFLFTMLDCILSKGLALHNAVIYKRIEEVKRLIKSEPVDVFDRGKRSVLHLVALHGLGDVRITGHDILSMVEEIPHVADVIKSDVFGFNPVDYAIENQALLIANKMCEKAENITVSTFIEGNRGHLRSCDIWQYKALFKKLFQYEICYRLLENDINENKQLVDCLPSFYNEQLENICEYVDEFDATTVAQFLEKLGIKSGSYYSNLHLAVAFGTDENIHELLLAGAEINERLFGRTPLHYAIKHNRIKIFNKLLSEHADTDITDMQGNTALHLACKVDDELIVYTLLQNSVKNVNDRNKIGETPLLLAIKNNHVFSVLLLLTNNANGDGEDKYGYSCLHLAAQSGHYHVVQELIRKSLDVNKRNEDGRTPLYLALKGGHASVARLLLSYDADINVKNEYQMSCLHFAARAGFDDIVLELINKGLDVNKRNKDGRTPLFYALENSHSVVAKLLLEMGADVSNEDNVGNSCLHLAVKCDDDVVQELITKGLDVNKQNKSGETPLFQALRRKCLSTAKLLLSSGSDVELKTSNGSSLLHYAAKSGCLEMWLNLLTDDYKTTDINIKNNDNETTLHFALFKYYFETYADIEQQTSTINFLLSNGADINVQDADGNTVLHYVSKYGYYHSRPKKADMDNYYKNIADTLLNNNADVNLKNKDGKTALDLATESNHLDIISLIKLKLGNA